MINLDELLEILDENSSLSGGVRYVAEYLTNKKYCASRDTCCSHTGDNCIECWMMTLTDEVENNKKSKGKNK